MYKGLMVQETMLLYGCGVESSNIKYTTNTYILLIF